MSVIFDCIRYRRSYKFLKRLENSKWLLELYSLEIYPKEENLKAKIILKIYAQTEKGNNL